MLHADRQVRRGRVHTPQPAPRRPAGRCTRSAASRPRPCASAAILAAGAPVRSTRCRWPVRRRAAGAMTTSTVSNTCQRRAAQRLPHALRLHHPVRRAAAHRRGSGRASGSSKSCARVFRSPRRQRGAFGVAADQEGRRARGPHTRSRPIAVPRRLPLPHRPRPPPPGAAISRNQPPSTPMRRPARRFRRAPLRAGASPGRRPQHRVVGERQVEPRAQRAEVIEARDEGVTAQPRQGRRSASGRRHAAQRRGHADRAVGVGASVSGTWPAATAAAEPPDEPPLMRVKSCGLRASARSACSRW